MNNMKRQKDRTLEDELPRSEGAQYATGNHWRNNSRKNEGMEPKQKQHPVVNGTGLHMLHIRAYPVLTPLQRRHNDDPYFTNEETEAPQAILLVGSRVKIYTQAIGAGLLL